MPAVPNWCLGRHLTAVTLTPQAVDTSGNLTAGTARTITGQAKSIKIKPITKHEDIRPVNSVRANHVITGYDTTVEIELIIAQGATGNALTEIWTTYDYVNVSFTRGGKTWAGYFVIGELEDGIAEQGKNVATLALHQVDIGALPTYS